MILNTLHAGYVLCCHPDGVPLLIRPHETKKMNDSIFNDHVYHDHSGPNLRLEFIGEPVSNGTVVRPNRFVDVGGRERLEQVASGYNSNQLARIENGNALDPVPLQEHGNFRKGRCLADRDYSCRHHVPGCASMDFGIVSCQSTLARKKRKPPGSALLADGFYMPNKVSFTYDSEDASFRVDDRQTVRIRGRTHCASE